jgi:hypothetical protein
LLDGNQNITQRLALATTLAIFCENDHVVEAVAANFPCLLAVVRVLVAAVCTNVLEKGGQQRVEVLVKVLFPLCGAELILESELPSERTSATVRRPLCHRELINWSRIDRPLACSRGRYFFGKIRSSPLLVVGRLKYCFLLFGPLRQLT